jgi:hypothetical protein
MFKLINIQLNKLSVYEDWILTVRKDAHGIYTQMKELDNKEIFRRDDEVGVVFQDLVELIEWLNKRVMDEEDDSSK